jgi:general secretion pathway protein A
VRHRIVVAGGEGKVRFTGDALTTVHRLSGGVPRLLNLLCDRSLLAGYVAGSRTITTAMVRQAAREVAVDRPAPALRWHHGLIAAGLTLVLALLAFTVAPRLAQAPEPPALPARPPALVPAPAPASLSPPPRRGRLDDLLRSLPRPASFAAATRRIESAWGDTPLSRTPLRTHLGQLRALGLPAALEMFHPSRRDTCFLALLRLDDGAALVGAGPPFEVALSQIDALWTRDAVVFWPEPPAVRTSREARDAWARAALSGLGYAEPDLPAAVTRFQREGDLVPDGLLGPRTRMALFARSTSAGPRLLARGAAR